MWLGDLNVRGSVVVCDGNWDLGHTGMIKGNWNMLVLLFTLWHLDMVYMYMHTICQIILYKRQQAKNVKKGALIENQVVILMTAFLLLESFFDYTTNHHIKPIDWLLLILFVLFLLKIVPKRHIYISFCFFLVNPLTLYPLRRWDLLQFLPATKQLSTNNRTAEYHGL